MVQLALDKVGVFLTGFSVLEKEKKQVHFVGVNGRILQGIYTLSEPFHLSLEKGCPIYRGRMQQVGKYRSIPLW